MFGLRKATTSEDVQKLAGMAFDIWHECFPDIISEAQIDYMLERFRSYPAMQMQMREHGYCYYFIESDGIAVGYTAIQPEEKKLFLSKLYLYSAHRGKGYARKTVEALQKIGAEQGKHAMNLTVNRNNARAIAAYCKMGFTVTGTQDAPIGNGYVMDDFLMELSW